MKYRAEVDGLRAVAILPVIFFHAGFKTFEGGFVGVDVFFVVSGYLITTIILSDMDSDKFSIVTFYERRARRIMPALFFVMLCCLPFSWMWLLPQHLKDFSESLIAVSVFSSNVLFWQESDYFGVASELKPLLHTWSLAVEEQYYVLFPLFLMLLWRLRKRWIFGALMVVGAASLALAQWGAYNKPIATFFLLPTRAWELAIGALIAFYFLYKHEHAELTKRYKKTSEVLGAVGLLMILYAVFALNNNTPFPSLYALIPTVGTGLVIIFATSETTVGKLLSTKFMVGVGLISYSTYLWHQPLFVFARHRSLEEPSTTLLILLSAASLLLAYISWRYVESPFRNKKLVSRRAVFMFTLVGSLVFIGIGLTGHMRDGYLWQWPKFIEDYYKIAESSKKYTWSEKNKLRNSVFDSSKIKLLIVGDSNSGDLLNVIQSTTKANKFSISTLLINNQCGNLFLERKSFSYLIPENRMGICKNADDLMSEGSKQLIGEADWVIFASNWSDWEIERIYESNKKLLNKYGDKFWYVGNKSTDFKGDDLKNRLIDRFPVTAKAKPGSVINNNDLKSVVGQRYIDLYQMFCEDYICRISEDSGEIIQYDGIHLTEYGSKYFAKKLNFFIDKLIIDHLNGNNPPT